MPRKPMKVLAHEHASVHRGWWYYEDIVAAFEAGWRASTKNRWPKAKVPKRRSVTKESNDAT